MLTAWSSGGCFVGDAKVAAFNQRKRVCPDARALARRCVVAPRKIESGSTFPDTFYTRVGYRRVESKSGQRERGFKVGPADFRGGGAAESPPGAGSTADRVL